MVRVVRRERNVGRVHGRRVEPPELPVRLGKVDLGVERRAVGALAPVRAVERPLGSEVEIRLAPDLEARGGLPAVRGEITRFPEKGGHRRDVPREVVGPVAVAAVVVGSDGRLEHPGHQGGPGSRTDRRGAYAVRVAHALGGEAVEIGSPDEVVPVAAQVRGEVLCEDPEDVRPRLLRGAGRGGEPRQRRAHLQKAATTHRWIHSVLAGLPGARRAQRIGENGRPARWMLETVDTMSALPQPGRFLIRFQPSLLPKVDHAFARAAMSA